ncbi:MAG: MnhB domain-containing protein [Actinomycetes bacterium]
MNTSSIAVTTGRALRPLLLFVALWLLWRGHDDPGGGFIASLVAGAAIALTHLLTPPAPERLAAAGRTIGIGLALSAAVAVAPLLLGAELLTSTKVVVLGKELATSLAFDVGVLLVVVGAVEMFTVAVLRHGAPDVQAYAGGPADVPDDGEVRA